MINRTHSTIAVALLACSAWSGVALAQDRPAPARNADSKTQVTPGKQGNLPNAEPASVERLDDNAQRIHDRNRSGAAPRSNTGGQQAGAAEGVRDWAAIDTNKDNLISPEEMMAFLRQGQATPAQAAPAASAASRP